MGAKLKYLQNRGSIVHQEAQNSRFHSTINKGEHVINRRESKLLELISDRKLSGKPNLDARVKKVAVPLYTCKRLVGPRWGITARVTRWLYIAVVRRIMTYGTLVKKYAVKCMESIQRSISISCPKIYFTFIAHRVAL